MKQLKNEMYKTFVRDHILRPYQNTLIGRESSHPMGFSRNDYEGLPREFEEKREWCELVFNRIAGIFDSIEASIFPSDQTSMIILYKMYQKGVRIIYT